MDLYFIYFVTFVIGLCFLMYGFALLVLYEPKKKKRKPVSRMNDPLYYGR